MPVLFAPGRLPRFPRFVTTLPATGTNVVAVYVSPVASADGYIAVNTFNNGGDHNEVWRFTSGTDAIRLTATLPINGGFRDYDVASGTTYFYYAVAVNADGTYIVSATTSASITLTANLLHIVAKNAESNVLETYGVLTIPLMAPVSRPSERESRELIEPGRTKSVIATSAIVSRTFQGTLIFTGFPNADFTLLQTMYALKRVFCVRDVKGHLLFGTITQFVTSYQHTYLQVELVVEESDYPEAV